MSEEEAVEALNKAVAQWAETNGDMATTWVVLAEALPADHFDTQNRVFAFHTEGSLAAVTGMCEAAAGMFKSHMTSGFEGRDD